MTLEHFTSKERRMFQKALQAARRRAQKKKLPFCLDAQSITDVFEKQNGNCFYSGIKMNILKSPGKKLHDEYKMTLDCINPDDGYTKENIVWCLYCINSFKQRMKKNEMFHICSKMLEFEFSKISARE